MAVRNDCSLYIQGLSSETILVAERCTFGVVLLSSLHCSRLLSFCYFSFMIVIQCNCAWYRKLTSNKQTSSFWKKCLLVHGLKRRISFMRTVMNSWSFSLFIFHSMHFLNQSRFTKKEKVKIICCGLILSILFIYFFIDVVLHLFSVNTLWPACYSYYRMNV